MLDSSGLIALLNKGDTFHDRVAEVLSSERGPRYLSPFVLQEIDHLVASRVGPHAALRFADEVAAGAYALVPFDRGDLATASAVMHRYEDMPVGLADASIVVLAQRYATVRLLTLDERHFRAIRPLQGGAFTILPADVRAVPRRA